MKDTYPQKNNIFVGSDRTGVRPVFDSDSGAPADVDEAAQRQGDRTGVRPVFDSDCSADAAAPLPEFISMFYVL